MKQKYFEDYRVGDTATCGTHLVSEEEIVAFAAQWDRLPFHLDRQAAASSHFGGLVASGCHVLAVALRLINASDARPAILGAIGWDEVRFLQPVRPGDRLTLELACLETRPSASKPDLGIVRQQFTLKSQRGEAVFRFKDMILVARRPAV